MTSFFLFLSLISLVRCNKPTENVITGFTVGPSVVSEGNARNTVRISVQPKGELHSTISVDYYTAENSALAEQDFVMASGNITFEPGQMEQFVEIQIIGDTHPEIIEQFDLTLNYENISTKAKITIEDDDPLEPVLSDAEGYYTGKDHPSMRLIWNDEFEGNVLDTKNWTYELGDGCGKGICGWGNDELQVYTDKKENVKVENGKLIITALKGNGYTSGRLKTEKKVEMQFGRIDVRARLPKGQGIWPAIWMLGANISQVGWPACGEIDIMELVGHQPSVVHGTVHYDDGGHKSSTSSRSLVQGDFSEKFHVFSIVWDRDIIEWYVDNERFKTFTKTNSANYPFNAPFFFLFNIAVGGKWPGNPDDTTVFPQYLTVDYIRVYQ